MKFLSAAIVTSALLSPCFAGAASPLNEAWQIEGGVDSFSSNKSGGLASATFGSLGFERQELVHSDLGYRFGVRKNLELSKGFFMNSGASLSFNSHEHEINITQNGSRIQRESDSRNLSLEQRLGYCYEVSESFVLRPFFGIGLKLQQTETTSLVNNGGANSGEQPTQTISDTFLSPTLGIEAFYKNYGLSLTYSQTQLSTPSSNIVTGNTIIKEGFDILNVLGVTFIYSF